MGRRELFNEPVAPTCPGCCFNVVCPTIWQIGIARQLRSGDLKSPEACYRWVGLALKHKQETGHNPPASGDEMLVQLGTVRTDEERTAAAEVPVGLLDQPYPWWEDDLAVLDCETTGTDPYTDRILSLALLLVSSHGDVIESWGLRLLINPGIEIPAEASAVHGLTAAEILVSGIQPADAIAQVIPRLEQLGRAGAPLVIYNASFDFPLLRAEAARCELILPDVALVDPLCMDRVLDRYRKGGRKLGTVAEHYGVKLPKAHEAGADAIAAVGIARAIAKQYAEVRVLSLSELQKTQTRWFEEWRTGMNSYWKKQGKKQQIEGTWPLGLGRPVDGSTPVAEAVA